MTVVTNAPRTVRRRLLSGMTEKTSLKIVSPKQSGADGWLFALKNGDDIVTFGHPIKTRDQARIEAVKRFGVKASEYRSRAAA